MFSCTGKGSREKIDIFSKLSDFQTPVEKCLFFLGKKFTIVILKKNTSAPPVHSEILKQPLFLAYRDNQPFNENHLRPCPMLENPEIPERIVKETGARSTDPQSPESAGHPCAKCREYAAKWADTADLLWRKAEIYEECESYKMAAGQ